MTEKMMTSQKRCTHAKTTLGGCRVQIWAARQIQYGSITASDRTISGIYDPSDLLIHALTNMH